MSSDDQTPAAGAGSSGRPLDIDRLVTELTLAEKAALLSGSDFWHTVAVERLGIPAIMVSDGPHGLRAQMNESDHVGLSGSVPATCFPTASAIASAWDPDLVRRVGEALGVEARHYRVSVLLGPGVNMKRSPLCGRNFEYFSEDPLLAGVLATSMVQGVQSQGIGTSVKHYAANNQESDRLRVSAEIDERTLREIYLPAFERVVTGSQPWTVMTAYNKVNGVYATEHHWLLTEVLRDEWGFDGLVVSDWGATHDRVKAAVGGLDLEMPPNLKVSPQAVVSAVEAGGLDQAVLDQRVRAVLGLVSRSLPALTGTAPDFDVDAHHGLAREAAARSAVLLKNDPVPGTSTPLLPLAAPVGRLAVVGEFARTPRYQGAGSSQVNPTKVDVALAELQRVFGTAEVDFAPGYTLDDSGDQQALTAEATRIAAAADAVVLFLGLPPADESEGFDRTHLNLPSAQPALLAALREVNAKIIVILVNGSVVDIAAWRHDALAVVECWLGGQAAGGGVADILTGVVNPSGRLAETIPLRLQDCSSYLNFPGEYGKVRYGEGVFIGYRGYDAVDADVAYPFGYGLSYTSFALSDSSVRLTGGVAEDDFEATVRVTVTNSGPVAGDEVVQVYVGDVDACVARPVRELAGFARVRLAPGESRQVSIGLDQRAFSFWSTRLGRWAVEAGQFEIGIGHHSRDLPLTELVTIDAPSIAAPLSVDSTLAEWLADPVGREAIAATMKAAGHGGSHLADPELIKVIGSMPLSTLAAFPGFDFLSSSPGVG